MHERKDGSMKRKNVQKDMVDFIMDFVEDKDLTVETVEVIHQKVKRHLNKVVLRENRKLMRKLKEGDTVWFTDKKGTEHRGELLRKERNDGLVVIDFVDGKNQIWNVMPMFITKTKAKKK